MPENQPVDKDFLKRITSIIEDHVSNEQFGVSELAREIGMSRSNLLRKIKKNTHLSASQFIRQVRLQAAMELLKESSLTVSEVSWKVGFSSTSYFIKCFREFYGYPPGEAGKRSPDEKELADQPHKSHQLAAIMFTDIQGYTALMQRDEEKAVKFRNRHREIFNATTSKFNGRILQYYGDGTLSTFSSAIDAVKCGIEMQRAFQQEPQIPVRVGIHTGDIIFTSDDIIGDGVNVASRIESLAVVGSVFISEKVFDEVKNQVGILTVSMGIFELKNVEKPIEVYAIANEGLVVPERDQISGKVKSRPANKNKVTAQDKRGAGIKWVLVPAAIVLLIILAYVTDVFQIRKPDVAKPDLLLAGKSIAVLPFINDSYDSSNVYIINGLMESILNNLQKIKDLRVVSRTSVEKYRHTDKSAREIAEELGVQYLIEGSGQKIGDQIKLSIQLIEGQGDRHLWSEQYNRSAEDIFNLQSEVAKNIASQIQVFISPEEHKRIDEKPTHNLVAYDHFLKGLDYFYDESAEGMRNAIASFQEAVKHDSTFARAYADIAVAYYYMDLFRTEKLYNDSINFYADKALANDPENSQGLFAKGLYFMNTYQYEMALPYFEKAHEFQPNSALIINFLSDYYTSYRPNTEKYLEYALRGVQLDIGSNDSNMASYILLHVGNALIQTGFVDEAETYFEKSLDYNPNNLFTQNVQVYTQLSQDEDYKKARDRLLDILAKDTTRLDILQEVGKIHYLMRDYKNAYPYYRKFVDVREAQQLQLFIFENNKIGYVFEKMGHSEESKQLFDSYLYFAEHDQSIYKELSLASYYAYKNDKLKALMHMQNFSEQDNYHFWIVKFLDVDPLMDNIKEEAEFNVIYQSIKDKFWKKHEQIRKRLEEEELL
jgi:TolB-like protein/class 3 adenylate cyclase